MAKDITTLITGGAGFIGSALALALRERGAGRVIALDNLRRRGSERNLDRLRVAGVEFVRGDVRNPEDLDAIGPVDALVECSAEPSVLAGYGDEADYVVQSNLVGALNCFEFARKHNAGVLFLSTSRVYPIEALRALPLVETETRFDLGERELPEGVTPAGIGEGFSLNGTRSLYGSTKLAAELILQEFVAMGAMTGVINRCSVVAGPGQFGKADQGFVTYWVERHLNSGGLQYIGYGGQGKQVRDVLHIDDLIALLLYELDHLSELSGAVCNVGGGMANSVSLRELTAICQEVTGNTLPIEGVIEARPGDVPWYVTDNRAVTEKTSWRPERSVRQVVEDTAQWMRTPQ